MRVLTETAMGRSAEKNGVEKVGQRVGFAKKARSLSFGDDRARGTAQIEIHFVVAEVRKRLRGPDKVGRAAREKLRYRADAGIVFRNQIAKLTIRELGERRRRHERHPVGVRAAEASRMNGAENKTREPFHGGNG